MKLRLNATLRAALIAASMSFTTLCTSTVAVATSAALIAGQQAWALTDLMTKDDAFTQDSPGYYSSTKDLTWEDIGDEVFANVQSLNMGAYSITLKLNQGKTVNQKFDVVTGSGTYSYTRNHNGTGNRNTVWVGTASGFTGTLDVKSTQTSNNIMFGLGTSTKTDVADFSQATVKAARGVLALASNDVKVKELVTATIDLRYTAGGVSANAGTGSAVPMGEGATQNKGSESDHGKLTVGKLTMSDTTVGSYIDVILNGAGNTISGSYFGEGDTVTVAKEADLTLSGTLGLYKPFDVSGTLTLSSDLVIDLSNLAYKEKEGARVYTLATLEQDAFYTGYQALTKSSIKGVSAEKVTFKNDGTIVLTSATPHTIAWDPNWGVTGPDALSAELTATTALITSPYKAGNVVAVELTGTGNEGAYIYGVQDSGQDSTGKTYEADVWINAKEGSYKAIIGASYCNNWGSGGTLNMEGDTHIQVEGATVGSIIGGNFKDGQSPHFTGNSYISVMDGEVDGDVTASIIGASTNSHNASTTFTGDTHIFIYVPLSTDGVNPLPDEGNYTAVPKNHIIGGISHMHNTTGTGTLEGNTNVTIDLSKYEGDRTTFIKSVTGGSHSNLLAHTQTVSGNTKVTINGGKITFTADIVGGNVNINGSSTIGGSSTLDITDGIYSGKLIGGSMITGASSSTVGDVVVNLGGKAQINGNVYAAGLVDGEGAGKSTVASTTVNLGANVVFGSVTLSGGFGGAGVLRGTFDGDRKLNLTDAKEYSGLSSVTVDAFNEISVVKDASATIKSLTNSPMLTKSGEGALTLALGEESALMSLAVGEGSLSLGAAGMDIMGISVASGATLVATAEASLLTSAITLNGGSALSVAGNGLVLGDDSLLVFEGGKVAFSTSGSLGQEIIVVAGLAGEESIEGITFNKTDKSGDKYADASDYLTLDTKLTDYTQLRLKDGKLILTKAASEGSYWGKDNSSGTWDLMSTKWADDDEQAATRTFTPANAAHFTAAGLGGDINVGSPINVTTIYVSGATYNFTNAEMLNITSGISVSESGVATFNKVAGELKNVNITGAESKLTISSGDVTVNAFSNEGTFTAGGNLAITSAVTAGGKVTAGGNVTLAAGTENVFGTLNATGMVTGASKLTVGGTSTIGRVEDIGTLALANGTLSLGTASGLASTQLNGTLTITGETVSLGSVSMADGSSISGKTVQATGGVTVSGGTATMAAGTLQTATVAGEGTLAVDGGTLGIDSDSTTTVSGTLDLKKSTSLSNNGTLAVAATGHVIAGNGINLGNVNATGTVEVNGASVSATGGSIANLDMGAGETLDVSQNLALSATTGDAGTLTVDGILTVNGAVALTNVTAGSLVMDATNGSLTATGTLDAGTITLGRVSKAETYVTAGSFSNTTTAFSVELALIEALQAAAGDIITLAHVGAEHGDKAALTINGYKYITDSQDIRYTISQNGDFDIVLTASYAPSDYVWTNNGGTTNWSDGANWSGGMVPGSDAWAQVVEGVENWTITMDQNGESRRLTIDSGNAEITGVNILEIHKSLEVNTPATLELSETVQVNAKEVAVKGGLNMYDAARLSAETINVENGIMTLWNHAYVETDVLNIVEGEGTGGLGGVVALKSGGLNAGTINMKGDTMLYLESEAVAQTQALNGTLGATVQGRVNITGQGGRYAGQYNKAIISVEEGAEAILYAGEGLTLEGDGTAKLQYGGNTAITGVDADALTIILNNPNESNIGSTLTLQQASRLGNGSVQFGMSALDSAKTIGSGAPVILQGDLSLGDGASVVVNQDSADAGVAMDVRNGGSTRNLVLARFGGANTNTRNVTLTGYLYGKYYRNARIENGALLVDMRDDFYRTVSGAHTPNGIAGGRMVDAAFVERNPQATNPNGDLAAVMTALETGTVAGEAADKTLAAMSGASIAAMGAAFGADVDRQLRAIRNRTTTMGLSDCLVNEDLPYFNAWVNAEGDYRKLNADGTLAGYKLSSWGGTVGFDVDCTPRFTCGLALTAMQGNFTANSAEAAEGDLDRMYVSAFARYTRRALSQTLVATFGRADAKLHRTVNYGAGAYRTDADTNGTAFGVMYEIGYAKALNEDATTCLQPVLNLSYRHSALGGFNEKGLSDAALTAGDAEMNVFTAAIGARLQSVVGTSVYNRSSLFEGRVLLKLDSGDRDVAVRNHFVGIAGGADAKSAEVGAFGVEIGAGITLPIAEDGGSLFFDVTGEFRSGYSEVNGTVGYRFNF